MENLNHVFCFVSSANTEEFSALALESFFNKTKLEKGGKDIYSFSKNVDYSKVYNYLTLVSLNGF